MLGIVGLVEKAREKVNGNKGKALSLLIAGIVVLSIAVTATHLNGGKPMQEPEHHSLPYIGQMQMAYLNDGASYDMGGSMYKNASGEYYLAMWDGSGNDVEILTSNSGVNWSLCSGTKTDIDTTAQGNPDAGVWDWFTYNNEPSFFYLDDGDEGYIMIAHYNGTSWTTISTGILGKYHARYGIGSAIKYYDGTWQLVTGRAPYNTAYLSCYTGTPYDSWTLQVNLEAVEGVSYKFTPSLEIFNGTLVCTYKDGGNDLHWQTYDGISWTDKGDIKADIDSGCSMTKDPVNDKLVLVYNDNSTKLYYRELTDIGAGWGSEILLLDDGAYTSRYPHASFIDNRTVVSFSNNHRGNYNIYTIACPEYVTDSGLTDTYHRIPFPDATPNQANVNSSVFNLTNNNGRNITTITWHFENIGSIVCANNFRIWTNMSGTWTNASYNNLCDASGDVALIDISAEMQDSGEWNADEITYWKVEILDVGAVPEDLHSVDESIFYKITLA